MKMILVITGLALVALAGCNDSNPAKKRFVKWWESLEPQQQEYLLNHHDETIEPWRYRITLEDNIRENNHELAEMADWVNTLTPEQLEAYDRFVVAEKLKNRKGCPQCADIAKEILGSETIRTDVLKDGKPYRFGHEELDK